MCLFSCVTLSSVADIVLAWLQLGKVAATVPKDTATSNEDKVEPKSACLMGLGDYGSDSE